MKRYMPMGYDYNEIKPLIKILLILAVLGCFMLLGVIAGLGWLIWELLYLVLV